MLIRKKVATSCVNSITKFISYRRSWSIIATDHPTTEPIMPQILLQMACTKVLNISHRGHIVFLLRLLICGKGKTKVIGVISIVVTNS